MHRALDIILSSIALLVFSPVLIVVAALLRLTGEGEVLFVQSRIGLGGREFGLYKFATMLKNSPSIGTGTVTLKNDPRVLPLGRFLRKTKINELPQLLNVLQGQMSIIGPRPQTRRCFDAFPPRSQEAIKRLRPGLSGIGSIVFRNEEEMMDQDSNPDQLYDQTIMPFKGLLEEWYEKNYNLSNYIVLILLTIWVILRPKRDIIWKAFPSLPVPDSRLSVLLDSAA